MKDIPARLAEASRSLGILAAQARAAAVLGDELPADTLRDTAQNLHALADDLTAHADDIDLEEAPC